MVPAGQLVEVPHVEPLVPLAVEPEEALELPQGHPARRRDPPAPIEQARDPELLKSRAPASHAARTQSDDVGHLEPGLPAMQGM